MSVEERLSSLDRRLSQLLSGLVVDPALTRVLSKKKDPYFYRVQFLPLPASVSANQEFTIENDSEFVCLGANAVVTDTSDVAIVASANTFDPFNPPFLATIKHSGSGGQNLMNAGVAFANIFGTGREPYYWPIPKIFGPRSVVTVTLENLAITDRRIRIAFVGFKAYS
jgi:hypothetical protein